MPEILQLDFMRMAFAAGAMIFVVVEEVVPESQTGGHPDVATSGAIAGFVLGSGVALLLWGRGMGSGTGGGASSARSIHAGMPAMSRGAAINVNSRCWVMCMR